MQRSTRLLSCALILVVAVCSGAGSAFATGLSKDAKRSALSTSSIGSKTKRGPIGSRALIAGFASVGSDDDIPGVSIPASPINGTLDEDYDWDDVYAVYLTAGQSISASLTAAPDTDFDLFLFAPGTTSVSDDPYLVCSTTESYPESITFNVPTSGIYYLDAYDYYGSGAYSISYTIGDTPISDDDVPGISALPSPISGTLDKDTDANDVYAISLFQGEVFSAAVSGVQTTDYNLNVFGPGATSISSSPKLAKGAVTSYPDYVDFVAPVTGTYYIDVYSDTGSGGYTLEYAGSAGHSTVSLSAATTCRWPGSMNFWAKVLEFGRPLQGQAVILQKRPIAGQYTSLKTGRTVATGNVGIAYAPASTGEYRALIIQGGVVKVSETWRVTLIPYLTVGGPSSVARGKTFSIWGYLGPRHTNGAKSVAIKCYRNGVYKKTVYATNYNVTSSTGKAMTKYIGKLSLGSRGTWTLKAVLTGDNTHAARSVSKTVKIY